jgi:hypothetical protein
MSTGNGNRASRGAISATKLRLVAYREGKAPYDEASRNARELTRALADEKRAADKKAARSAQLQEENRKRVEEARARRDLNAMKSENMSIQTVMKLHRRVRTIQQAADALLDFKDADLKVALGDPEKWHETAKSLADAKQAIEQLQQAVGRLVPA